MTTRREFLAHATAGAGITLAAWIAPSASANNARFSVADGQFMLDGKPFQILAGEMHYPRIPHQLWRDRMRKLKSLGLNTLSTYVFWNAHEPRAGHYIFSGDLDVAAYIRMAQEEGLWVNLRPGPFVCAEWDGGGIPAWVLNDPAIAARSLDERYMEPVRTWLQRLGQELKPLLLSNGGPIILTQVENEYGSYGADAVYMRACHRALLDAGFDGVFYTADGAAVMAGGVLPELPAGVNFGTNDKAENEFATRAKVRAGGPFFCAELWGGWFDHFGETHTTVAIPPLLASLEWMLQRGYSLSFYMLHGGTSFGFSAGANSPEAGSYQPDISSYDYDAILDEAGRPTAKYEAVKALFARYLPADRFAPWPVPERGVEIARFSLRECAPLSQLLGAPVRSEHPQTLEALGQSHGLMLYRHQPRKKVSGALNLGEVRDYALVSAAGESLGTLDRRFSGSTIDVTCPAHAPLDVLVDTTGHINYGPRIGKDQKGLIGTPTVNGAPLVGWDHYGLPLDDLSRLRFVRRPVAGPAFYRGTFKLEQQGYTFLDLRGWGKGYVWVNGHNLGRYWSVGPQQSLFVPAPWLNVGDNEVIVLDLHAGGDRTLAGGKAQIWDVAGAVKQAPKDLCSYVDPFIGTGGHGHTFPGATLPFGMVQLSPDTDVARWDACSGYHYDDGSMLGFSHTHLSGTGIGDMLDVLVVPAVGEVRLSPGTLQQPESSYRARFDHADERASPGYYRVLLEDRDVEAELTVTARAAIHRYRFNRTDAGHLLVDLSHGIRAPDALPRISAASLRVIGNDTLVGGRRTHQWADGRVQYFALRVSRPFSNAQLYTNDTPVPRGEFAVEGTHLKCVLHFPDAHAAPLLVKVGLSAVDIDGAIRNLDSEIPEWDFDSVHAAARAAWERELSRAVIEGGSESDRRIFYTALYHTLLAPTLFSDVDGRYRGMDKAVHRLPAGANNYSTYSLWDTYRALHPLFTLIQADRVPDLLGTLVRMAEESPAGPPIWPLQGVETRCMIGWHSAVVLSEAYAKGFTGIDFRRAWPVFRKRAFQDPGDGMSEYRRLGYIPSDSIHEAVSKTLEYAYDDWAMAKLAEAAGATEDAKALRERSRNYRHLFDRDLTFMRPRHADGRWVEPFDPRALGHRTDWHDFTECNSWQATFLNQHDVPRYMQLFGGPAAFERKLDELFSASSELPPDAPPDIAGLVGQYAHGNEPSHHIPYLYTYAGAPHKTQARVRMLMKTMYRDAPDGLVGNEDCGQMSAWYLMSAFGLYAVDPVSGNYVFGSPLFDRVRLTVAPGRVLIIEALNNAPDHPYIQSVRWNDQPHAKAWISHAQLREGGRLIFEMGPKPSPALAG